MPKPFLFKTMLVLTAVVTAVTVKAVIATTTPAVALQATIPTSTQTHVAQATADTTPITPAAITGSEDLFVGAGDGSVGSWIQR